MVRTVKKVVIAGSASLVKAHARWVLHWNDQEHCTVIDYPCPIDQKSFLKTYPRVHKKFFKNIQKADIFFVANEDKKGIDGYIGAETFAELTFAVVQKLLEYQKIEIMLAKMPSRRVQAYKEICLWLELGWIKIYSA